MDKPNRVRRKTVCADGRMDVQIEMLKEQAESTTAEKQLDYSRMVAALRLKRDQAAEQIWGEVRGLLRDSIRRIR